MAAPVGPAGGTVRLHAVLVQHGPAYLARFGGTMPARQGEVLRPLLQCRTPALGSALHLCTRCGERHFTYPWCHDRHWAQCGAEEPEAWRAAQQALVLPVPYFLVTFTVPEKLRGWPPSLAPVFAHTEASHRRVHTWRLAGLAIEPLSADFPLARSPIEVQSQRTSKKTGPTSTPAHYDLCSRDVGDEIAKQWLELVRGTGPGRKTPIMGGGRR